MSLKELTAANHRSAESTLFMKAVFSKTLPQELWIDWTYQKTLFYHTLENAASTLGLLNDLPDIRRAFYLYEDFKEMANDQHFLKFKNSTKEYHNYLLSINQDPNKIMAHLYTWHMGDLFGGQMIKEIIPAPHRSLEFNDPKTLMTNIRAKLNDDLAEEANVAFAWAIRMLREYDSSLE